MLRFEIKKVFSKTKNRITIIVLLVILIATSILTINRVEYVDESGNHLTGISAAKNLREAKNEWSGYLTEDVFQNVLEENRSINNEASSDSIEEENKRFAKKQGFQQSEMLSIMRLANTEIIMILPLITFLMMKPALSMKEEFLL